MVGGLDSGKVLRVVGMAATMRLSDRGPDDAVNRRISLLVLNKQAEQAILHENAESQNEPVSALKNLRLHHRSVFPQCHQPNRGDSVSMDISDFYQTFFDEADELLADMEQHLLVLQPEAPRCRTIECHLSGCPLDQRRGRNFWLRRFAGNHASDGKPAR